MRTSASVAGPSLQSLPPVVLPILPPRQPFRVELGLPVASASENVADLTMLDAPIPQRQGETKQAYARRLHRARPHLTRPELSRLSGVMAWNLKQDPAFQALPEHLARIREQLPQREGESNIGYARRLHSELSELSRLSGVTEQHLKEDPAFRAPLADLAPIREQLPQLKGESNPAYARRVHREHPHLTWSDLSLLSGVTENNLKNDPAFWELPDRLARIREQVPQRDCETNLDYARRLRSEHPQLTLHELSQLSCVLKGNLKRYPAFKQAPTLSTGVGSANSALPGSASSRVRGLKRTAIEAAAAQPVPQEALAIRSVRPRLTDERGRQHPPNVQAAPAQAAGTDASQLQELLAYQELLRSTPLAQYAPASTPGLEPLPPHAGGSAPALGGDDSSPGPSFFRGLTPYQNQFMSSPVAGSYPSLHGQEVASRWSGAAQSRTLGGSSVSRHSTLASPTFGGLAPIMENLPAPSHSRGTYPSAQGLESFTPGPFGSAMTVSAARVGLAESQPQRSASSIGPAAFDHMIQEPVGQPGELHIVAGQRPPPPPAAPSPGSALRAQPQTGTPPRTAPAVLLLQANELDIETGIAVMRQRGLPQDAAERAVGLPAGVLSAVVDGQGRWLGEQAQSGAAVGLPAEQLQQLALLLGRMRDHLQDLPAQAVQVSASSSSPMRPLQEHELDDFIHEMSQQIEPVRAGRRRAQAS
ncbi:MAG: hypothetical protein JF606_25135, partial [Burkholderiales bacterium]|nr:hypothetical protein [Burkholderiales bacterium]